MPATLHDFPKQEEAERRDFLTPVFWASCRHCDWGFDEIRTYNAVFAKAYAHSAVNGHETEIHIDSLADVIRAEDTRR